MSREDPQFKLRMPADLRVQAENAARLAGRSLNAELVARLETSFLSQSTDRLMPASRARELAAMARAGIPEEIRRRALQGINRSVELGHSSVSVDLRDMHLDGAMTDEEFERLVAGVNEELAAAGYSVDWDGVSWIWIEF